MQMMIRSLKPTVRVVDNRRFIWNFIKAKIWDGDAEPDFEVLLWPNKALDQWQFHKLGSSHCTASIEPLEAGDMAVPAAHRSPQDVERDTSSGFTAVEPYVPTTFLKFSGRTVYSDASGLPGPANGTFCAMNAAYRKSVDLRDYEGLELLVRAERRMTFALNMGCFSMVAGDLYQTTIDIPGQRWTRVQVPFAFFRVISEGLERHQQRSNDSLQLENLGILVTSKQNQDFQLDFQYIKAVGVIDRALVKAALKHHAEEQEDDSSDSNRNKDGSRGRGGSNGGRKEERFEDSAV